MTNKMKALTLGITAGLATIAVAILAATCPAWAAAIPPIIEGAIAEIIALIPVKE
jgi:hypothetical protein